MEFPLIFIQFHFISSSSWQLSSASIPLHHRLRPHPPPVWFCAFCRHRCLLLKIEMKRFGHFFEIFTCSAALFSLEKGWKGVPVHTLQLFIAPYAGRTLRQQQADVALPKLMEINFEMFYFKKFLPSQPFCSPPNGPSCCGSTGIGRLLEHRWLRPFCSHPSLRRIQRLNFTK